MARLNIEYPKNLSVTGTLAFPLRSVEDLERIKEWRSAKGLEKPRFDDVIGATIFIKENQYNKVVEYFEKTYMPFLDTLYKESDGKKGIDAKAQKMLLMQLKERDWSLKNWPLRELTEKDIEHNGGEDCPFVAKVRVQGPYDQQPIVVKALVRDSAQDPWNITSIEHLAEGGILPEGTHDTDRLWWGTGWTFRTSLRMNAYKTANIGVSAYANSLYLIPEAGLPMTTSTSEADVLEDGDEDWEDVE